MLEPFGLSHIADRIYLTAVEHPGQSVNELVQSLNLSLEELEAGYHELVESGLAHLPAYPTVAVVAPQYAADLLIARQESELIAQQALLSKYRAHAEQLKTTGYFARDLAAESETIAGSAAIWERLHQLNADTTDEIVSLKPGGALEPEFLASDRENHEEMFARGIKFRGVYLNSVRNDPATMEYLRWLLEQGAEVRTVPTLPIRMIIADKKSAVLPLDITDSLHGINVHHNASEVTALQALFEMIWASATPLGATRLPDGPGLTDDERAVLELVAIGRTDAQIAKKMGISERSARRIIKTLMDRMGAKTRVEGIYRATKNKWL